MFDFKFDWAKNFETGIESIDIQHKQLFKLGRDIEQLLRIQCIGVTDAQLLDIVCGLRDFTGYHFYAEESMMQEMNYPGYEQHKKYHEACSDYIMKLDMPKLKADPLTGLKRMHEEVKSWITFHVLAEDLNMAKAYEEYKKGLEKESIKETDPLEALYGKLVCEFDVTKLFLYKDQSCKGHLVAVFKESAKEMVKLSTLERNMYFADITKAAKMIKKCFEPDAIRYLDLEDQNDKLTMHIIPSYKDTSGYGLIPVWDTQADVTDTPEYQEIYDNIKKFL